MWARIASAVVGCWLTLSIYFWEQSGVRGFMNLVLGLVLVLTGICGIWIRSLRYFDGVLGLCLIASFASHNYQPAWVGVHDLIIGALVLVLAAMPGADGHRYLDHWVERFDRDPALLKRPFRALGHA